MVSVCMASFNGARFIREQIDSILAQLKEGDELIVSDDGSTDGTVDILNEYAQKDARVKVLRHAKNPEYEKITHCRSFYYATDNFENALNHARGDYIFLSDQDDVWREDKVSKMVPHLDNCDCVMSNAQVIDERGNPLFVHWEKQPFSASILKNLANNPFTGCCMAFSRKSLSFILPFPRKLIAHDLWMGVLCARKHSMLFLDEPLHNYRYHPDAVSSTKTPMAGRKKTSNPLWFKIKYRVDMLFHIVARLAFNK